jgi:phosphate-selective porin OprO/OprP
VISYGSDNNLDMSFSKADIARLTVSSCLFLLCFSPAGASTATAQGGETSLSVPDLSETSVTTSNGVRIESKDGLFSMRLGFRMQSRVSYDDMDGNSSTQDLVEMQTRRIRLRLNGHVLGPQLKYALQLGFSRGDQDWDTVAFPNVLRDANVTWEWAGGHSMIFGLRKLPGNRQRVNSSGSLEFVDRALTNATFNLDRDTGVQSWHKFGADQPAWLKLALTSGEGRNQKNSGTGLSTTARVEWLPAGSFKDDGDYFEGDLSFEPEARYSLGAVYNYNGSNSRTSGQNGSLLSGNATRNIETWILDGLWKRQGWSFSFEAFQRNAESPIVNSNQAIYAGRGLNLQVSHTFASNWAPALRWSIITPESVLRDVLDERTQATVGLTRYIKKHSIKVQGDVTHESVAERIGQASMKNMYYRLQLEVGI